MNWKKFLLSVLLLCLAFPNYAQDFFSESKAPIVGLKTNIPYWGTTTPNLGIEFRLAKKWSLDIEAGLNPFDGKNDDGSYDRSLKHFRLHPEARYWFCEAFNGHFLGLHVPYLIYNIADIKILGTFLAVRQALEHRGYGGCRLSLSGIRPLSVYQLRHKAGCEKETLCRSYSGGCQSDLCILK